MNKGLLYVATGRKYVEEAIESIKSYRRIHPDISAVIYTDTDNQYLAGEQFEDVRVVESPVFNFLDKIEPLKNTPFDYTLFVDTDTYCADKIDDLWQVLEDYDIAFTFDTGRINDPVEGVPDWFSEYSTGILLYKKFEKLNELIDRWKSTYIKMLDDKGITFDQTSFRKVLWEIKPNFYLLPQEYNFYTFSNNISANDYPVRIFHGRYTNLEEAIDYLKSDKPTLYFNDFRFLEYGTLKSFNYYQSKGFVFKWFIKFLNYYYRLTFRLGLSRNAKYSKRKGND